MCMIKQNHINIIIIVLLTAIAVSVIKIKKPRKKRIKPVHTNHAIEDDRIMSMRIEIEALKQVVKNAIQESHDRQEK